MTINSQNMKTEIEKLEQYLSELESRWPTNPELIKSVTAFEAWEQSFRPKAFEAAGPDLAIGGRALRLPGKRKFLVRLAWNFGESLPEMVAEDAKGQHRFPLAIKDGKVEFQKGEQKEPSEPASSDGEKIEVVYDVIDMVLDEKPDADVFKLKKTEFVEMLGELHESYDKAFLNRMAKLSAAEIKKLVETAACDMAIDDLSSQLCLPMEQSFAYGRTAAADKDGGAPAAETREVPPKTKWQILQELELLRVMARFNQEAVNTYAFSLKNSEPVSTEDPSRTVVRVKNEGDMVFHEGARLDVLDSARKNRVGVFLVGLFDYDTLYGEILWEVAGEGKNLESLYLRPQTAPHKIVMYGMEALCNLVAKDPDRVQGVLRVLLGLDSAAITIPGQGNGDRKGQAVADMDFSQYRAWAAATDPKNPFAAVQGPPGAGKTWVLSRIIRDLCERGCRLLITAPSNKAVDNVCMSLLDLPILRFGIGTKIDPIIRDTCWADDPENADRFLKKYKPGKTGAVYAATHVRALTDKVVNGDFKQRGHFDWVIFDEAGMSRMDEFLLCAQLGKRAVVFGDQQQLPPFPLSAEALKRLRREQGKIPAETKRIVDCGALEWLAAERKAPLIMLERSYRCQNPRLMRFSSTLFYNAIVKTSEKAEYFRLPYYQRKKKYPRSTLRFYCTSFLPENVKGEKVVVEDARIGIENPCEAYVCRHLLLEAVSTYPLDQIAVITPYKLQAARIRELLQYETVKEFLPRTVAQSAWNVFLNVKIATVDSFQGGESDIVLISYVRSNKDKGIGFVDNLNRINVAHTRCRRAIAIVGDLECLKRQAGTDVFARMERAFARDGEIVDLDEELFGQMSGVVEIGQ